MNIDICIAGKNSIAIAGLSYILRNYNDHSISVLVDENDDGNDNWQPSFLKYAKENNISILELEDIYELENLCFISLEYFKLIDPKKFISDQLFNIHFSLLPAYRGMYTSAHPILNGEERTGCTIHKIDEGIDTGNIISQISFEIDPKDNCKNLYEKYLHFGQNLLFKTIDSLIHKTYSEVPQGKENSSYFSKKSINYNNLEIDFTRSSEDVIRQFRAYSFRDYQLIEIINEPIFGCKLLDTVSNEAPGTIIEKNHDSMAVSTLDHDVEIYIDQFPQLISAIKSENLTEIERIIRLNSSYLNERDETGKTPLILSCEIISPLITRLILEYGADPNYSDSRGVSPLVYAIETAKKTSRHDHIEALLVNGANRENLDIFGRSLNDYIDKNHI